MDYTIPEDWLAFCDVANWTRGSDYCPYTHIPVEVCEPWTP